MIDADSLVAHALELHQSDPAFKELADVAIMRLVHYQALPADQSLAKYFAAEVAPGMLLGRYLLDTFWAQQDQSQWRRGYLLDQSPYKGVRRG